MHRFRDEFGKSAALSARHTLRLHLKKIIMGANFCAPKNWKVRTEAHCVCEGGGAKGREHAQNPLTSAADMVTSSQK